MNAHRLPLCKRVTRTDEMDVGDTTGHSGACGAQLYTTEIFKTIPATLFT